MKVRAAGDVEPADHPTLEERLHRAAALNDIPAVKELLAAGAKVNAADRGGSTSLRCALINRETELADLLRQHGGAVLGVRTVFDDAQEGNLERLQAAVADAPLLIDAMDHDGWTLLHWAARGNALGVAQWLIERGVDVSAKTRGDERTALHWAASADSPEIAELLIDSGADPQGAAIVGTTPLHDAASCGAARVAQVLLARGATVGGQASGGDWTPLHCAAACGRKTVARVLLDHGADVNACGDTGETPLHCAAGWGHVNVVQLLILGGADISAQDRCGRTPLDRAVRCNRTAIARLLLAHNGASSEPAEYLRGREQAV